MKLLLALLLPVAAIAGPVDNMVAQCEEVMRCELCQVANSKPRSGNVVVVFKDNKGVTRHATFPAAEYNFIRDTGYKKTAEGKFLMCERVREVMKTPDTTQALGARALFSATWKKQEYCPTVK